MQSHAHVDTKRPLNLKYRQMSWSFQCQMSYRPVSSRAHPRAQTDHVVTLYERRRRGAGNNLPKDSPTAKENIPHVIHLDNDVSNASATRCLPRFRPAAKKASETCVRTAGRKARKRAAHRYGRKKVPSIICHHNQLCTFTSSKLALPDSSSEQSALHLPGCRLNCFPSAV